VLEPLWSPQSTAPLAAHFANQLCHGLNRRRLSAARLLHRTP